MSEYLPRGIYVRTTNLSSKRLFEELQGNYLKIRDALTGRAIDGVVRMTLEVDVHACLQGTMYFRDGRAQRFELCPGKVGSSENP